MLSISEWFIIMHWKVAGNPLWTGDLPTLLDFQRILQCCLNIWPWKLGCGFRNFDSQTTTVASTTKWQNTKEAQKEEANIEFQQDIRKSKSNNTRKLRLKIFEIVVCWSYTNPKSSLSMLGELNKAPSANLKPKK